MPDFSLSRFRDKAEIRLKKVVPCQQVVSRAVTHKDMSVSRLLNA
ncbi:hypothetical protein [Roseibium sp. Sym1]|nr:hypothetical protein [Roseibium sp. Sym1]